MLRGALTVAVLACCVSTSFAGDDHGLKSGSPDIKSAGPLVFGPDGVLFVGDTTSAAVFAIDTKDAQADPAKVKLSVKAIDKKIAALLGAGSGDIAINDMAINPASGNAFLCPQRPGAQAAAVIVKLNSNNELSEVALKNISFAKADLPNPPAPGGTGRRNSRQYAITDLGFIDGRVIVSGLSNEEFASNLRSIPFPFDDAGPGTSVEIYHGAHGKLETRSPVRTFVPFDIGGKPHVVAAYTCTPLVTFPVSSLGSKKTVRGRTVAELGNRNQPLDMVAYKKGGQYYILIANSARGVMKVQTADIATVDSIEDRVSGGGTAGLKYDTIKSLQGVVQLDKLNDTHAVVVSKGDSGQDLQTIELP